MTLIYAAAEYSLRRERSRDELVASMEKILRESRRTTALIDDLLLLARGDAGWEAAELTSLDAAPLLRDVAEQATAMAAAKRIGVSLRLDGEELPVRANETS
jgi:signal transduction histidine kinase